MIHRFRTLPLAGKRCLAPFLLLVITGCGTLVGPEPSPTPKGTSTPRPAVQPPSQSPAQSGNAGVPLVLPHPPLEPLDPILDSPWANAPEMEEDVRFWLESFQTREADLLRESLVRMGRYRGMVEAELAARRLPQSLAYLPIVESWYNPTAVSWVGAVGLWQFMTPTARGMGLQVNRLIDDRRDPYRATPRALDFLGSLRERFGSWFLALAAYNGGPGRMDRLLVRQAPGAKRQDGLFLEVRQGLPRETRNFVPRFLAVAIIARDPAAYGFGDVVPAEPLVFDEVEIPDATSLDVVARAAGVDQRSVELLNPQLLRGMTPAGVSTRIRVPRGAGPVFADAYPLIPPQERVTFVEHVVASGETLTHIARDYGVTVEDLRAANPRVQPRRMQIGQRVVVPKAPSARQALRMGSRALAGEQELLLYRVRPGDTLSAIAVRHRVRVGDLLRWNDLDLEAVIRPGDEVKIYVRGGG